MGNNIMTNHKMGSSSSRFVLEATTKIKPILNSGHATKRIKKMVKLGAKLTLPPSSPFFIFSSEVASFAPTVMSCSAANNSPTFFNEVVSHALKIPPLSGSLKKAVCKGGMIPRKSPISVPMSGALKNCPTKSRVV